MTWQNSCSKPDTEDFSTIFQVKYFTLLMCVNYDYPDHSIFKKQKQIKTKKTLRIN